MRLDHEELLLRNPALGACGFWHVSRSFSEHRASGEAPVLPYFFVAAAMLFHRPTIEKFQAMRFESGFAKAISDNPDLISDLQQRIEDNAQNALRTIQVSCAARLLTREGGDGFPAFRAVGTNLPPPLREGGGSVPRMFNSAKRIGAWLASENIVSIRQQLNVEF